MSRLRARVENGRLVIDEPTDLPEGTVLDLVVDDEGDNLSAEEREALHAALARGIADADADRVAEATTALDELRRKE